MKEHEQFEKLQHQKFMSYVEFSEKHNVFVFKQPNTNLDKSVVLAELNFGWKMWQASMNRTDIVLVPKNHLEKSIGFMTTAQCHPSNSNEYEVSIDETIDVFSKILEQSNES